MKARLFLTIVLVVIIVVMTGSIITLAQGPKKVVINFATLEELQTLPGVGPETAQAIIDGRPYMNKKELQKVEGVGKKKFKRLQRLTIVKPLVINLATLDKLKALPGIDPETAQAIIDGDTVVVWSEEVRKPVAVRYAWSDAPDPNLFNKEGLPASSFRTDIPGN